jgi:hypothetical protein
MAMFALLSLIGCKKQIGQPKLVFSAESVEMGVLYKDNPYADFEIECRNEGAQRLNIYRVTTGCPCTEVLSVDSFIEPDEKGIIKGRLNLQEKPPGFFSEELVIFSDGSEEPLHYFLDGELKYK